MFVVNRDDRKVQISSDIAGKIEHLKLTSKLNLENLFDSGITLYDITVWQSAQNLGKLPIFKN